MCEPERKGKWKRRKKRQHRENTKDKQTMEKWCSLLQKKTKKENNAFIVCLCASKQLHWTVEMVAANFRCWFSHGRYDMKPILTGWKRAHSTPLLSQVHVHVCACTIPCRINVIYRIIYCIGNNRFQSQPVSSQSLWIWDVLTENWTMTTVNTQLLIRLCCVTQSL